MSPTGFSGRAIGHSLAILIGLLAFFAPIQQGASQDAPKRFIARTSFQFGDDLKIIVPVSINGTRMRCLVDTGATHCAIRPQAVQRVGLGDEVWRDAAGNPVDGPDSKATRIVRNATISFGGANFPGVELLVLPPHTPFVDSFDVILGGYVLRHGILYVDPGTKSLKFYAPGKASRADLLANDLETAKSIPIDVLPNPKFYVTGRINNRITVRFLLDTGSQVTQIPSSVVSDLALPLGRKLDVRSIIGKFAAHEVTLHSLELGDLLVRDVPAMSVVSGPEREKAHALLGMDILSRYRFLIDFVDGRLYLDPKRVDRID